MKTTKEKVEELGKIKETEKELLKSLLEDSIEKDYVCIPHNPKNYEDIKEHSDYKFNDAIDIKNREIVVIVNEVSRFHYFMTVFKESINNEIKTTKKYSTSDLKIETSNNLNFFCKELGNIYLVMI